ncbi:M10 family metallopeptidase [Mesorhizobium sp. BAC0120]|uniref:M10 family metallopeptidase n=1 Tax=Mesorhizobium sp. BAC0120 TaxID=3090670 RepID=UPI00298D44AA|nr:M10 family metallopeptidase [Mesorhizobium sp. BAC0120]MDW6021405.1 M10 family metallopeptidase [Mesorhizobium sp. BAC0120]
MTTPTHNSVGVTSNLDTAALGIGKYVADGEKWGGALGAGVTLDFSFFHRGYSEYYGYNGDSSYSSDKEPEQAYELTAGEEAAVRAALGAWSSFANLTFREVTDSATVAGDLRFGYTTHSSPGSAAHAYFPYDDPSAGDVWFDWSNFNPGKLPTIAKGSYDFLAILHEIGHALGLKHTFDDPSIGTAGADHMPAAQDNYFYSIMSYTASPWSAQGDNWASFYPTTPMYDDLVAIEALYGRSAHSTGNDTYTFNDGVKYWQAIQDTGGIDTIVYNGAENATINLNPGTFSALSEPIQFRNSSGGYTSTKSTVTIGPGVVIENAHGGNGNDTLTGNSVGNNLNGGAGNDVLFGGAGNDVLIGGPGSDRLNGGAGNDIFVFDSAPSPSNKDTIVDFGSTSGNDDMIWLASSIFTKLGGGAAHALSDAFFRLGGAAQDANDYVVYDQTKGALFYDPNGSAGGGAIQIATLTNKPVLTASDFLVV